MFVFERYFIFALPFVLLVVGGGITGIAGSLRGGLRKGFIFLSLMVMIGLNFPSTSLILHQDRQDYREAVRYVEHEITEGRENLVFSIGYAGEHFRYYARTVQILTPENLDEFSRLSQGKKDIRCLITAWLPDIRPPYEDKELYSERPCQVEIYEFVKRHFTLEKSFGSKYRVDVYRLER